MLANQYIIVKLTADQKSYTYWVVDPNDAGIQRWANGVPAEPPNALGNRTTSSSTLGTNIGAEMPTLST